MNTATQDSRSELAQTSPNFSPLDKAGVAALTSVSIEKMSCQELVQIVRASALSRQQHGDFDSHLPYFDHETLKRLAYLARRCCRNQGY